MKRAQPAHLFDRLITIYLATTLLLVAIIIGLAGYTMDRNNAEHLRQNGELVVDLLRLSAVDPILHTLAYDRLASLTRQLYQDRHDIFYVAVHDVDGAIVAAAGELIPPDLNPIQLAELSSKPDNRVTRYPFALTDHELIAHLTVGNTLLGFARIGLSARPSRDQLLFELVFFAGIALLLMVFSAILFYLLSNRHLSQPLIATAEIMDRYGEEPLDRLLPRIEALHQTLKHDELGVMADAFGRMVANIIETQAELQTSEEKYRLRTAELEQANRELEGFSYSVSHDLRSPLRAINGFIAILLDEHSQQLDAEGQRLFAVVRDSSQKMSQLIDDILALAHAGRWEINIISVDMNVLLNEIWAECSMMLDDREIRFERCDLPKLSCDPRAIRRIWKELLDNAVKFTRDRNPAVIEIGVQVEEERFRFWVQDNGAGFNPDYSKKLFTLFERLHGMDEFEGDGVGLAITQRLVQKLGGDIQGSGAVGRGARFEFTLPRYPQSS